MIKGKIIDDQVVLDIRDDLVHFWSPHMDFRVEDTEDSHRDHCTIQGMIGPRPSVWTLFMFFYFSIGLIGFGFTTHAISIWLMDKTISGYFWSLPLTILFMLTAYQAGKLGEKLGEDQVEILKDVVRKALQVESTSEGL